MKKFLTLAVLLAAAVGATACNGPCKGQRYDVTTTEHGEAFAEHKAAFDAERSKFDAEFAAKNGTPANSASATLTRSEMVMQCSVTAVTEHESVMKCAATGIKLVDADTK